MELEQILQRLQAEYTYDFRFKGLRQVSNPQRNTLMRIKTRYYYGVDALKKKKVGEIENPALKKHGVQIIEYKDAFFRSVIALQFSVPVFDSGDRQYDSRHTLYLFHGWTDISAVYCKEGYEIAELYILDSLTAVSEELREALGQAGFPVTNIQSL